MSVDWKEWALARIVHQDESTRIIAERERVKEQLRRLGKAFVDGLFDEIEYHRQKKSLEWELEALLIPGAGAVNEAGRLLADMPQLWAKANLKERHKLLTTILDAVYIDMKDKKSVISVKAKPAFKAVLGMANYRKSVFMVETGRVELPVQSGLPEHPVDMKRLIVFAKRE